MSTFSKTLALGLFLLVNACGASAVTGSRHAEGGGGGGGGPTGLARAWEPNPPPIAEQPMFDRQDADRNTDLPRDTASFRLERDCWRCR